ncbi:MAG: endonuclease/exonuclease/phosphatase family protein [Hyperionvirus sp.]|uniref:Endonuclease/exonuclease/phosphatase family protein n=1 Tax=Hyperionvirus sp. TaxID=2487770 RepID=A0A3G5AA36_9VIRU|nr:MAG: endonuclease/exonuclease/phosphatase family protein [Hyperionvirus sp.]
MAAAIAKKMGVKILTYNIWFDIMERDNRLESLVKIIGSSGGDVICLQEVVPSVYDKIVKYLGGEYKYIFPEKIEAAYGCMILSKYKGEYHEFKFDTHMGRMLHAVTFDFESQKITVATAHFESEFRKYNIIKLKQYMLAQEILNKLYEEYGPVIFCSDTNLLETEEKYFFGGDWEDCWKRDGANPLKEYTYDTKCNVNLQLRNIQKVIRSRIDRVVFRGCVELMEFDLVKGGEYGMEPSDHYGVVAAFTVSQDTVSI